MSEHSSNNSDRIIWSEGDYYADRIHVTSSGGIGISVGGRVIVKSLHEWFKLAQPEPPESPVKVVMPNEHPNIGSRCNQPHDTPAPGVSEPGAGMTLERWAELERMYHRPIPASRSPTEIDELLAAAREGIELRKLIQPVPASWVDSGTIALHARAEAMEAVLIELREFLDDYGNGGGPGYNERYNRLRARVAAVIGAKEAT